MAHRESQIEYIEFPAQDVVSLRAAKAFYGTVLGWTYQDWGEDYADTSSSGLGSGLNADPSHRPDRPLAVIYTADLEAARDRVLGAGGVLTGDIFAFPGGRRFQFTDPAGNELAIWSDQEIS